MTKEIRKYFNRYIKASNIIQTNRSRQVFLKNHSLIDVAVWKGLAIKLKLEAHFYHIRKITPRCLKKEHPL